MDDKCAVLLSPQDAQWLYDCNIVLITKQMIEDEKRVCVELSDRIYDLEKRLAEEKAKIETEGR